MTKIIKPAVIVVSLFFLSLFVIWIVTFILTRNEINETPIISMPIAGAFLLIFYLIYGIILAILNNFVYHLKIVDFLLFFYLSIFIYFLFALNSFGLLPWIKQIPCFDTQNLIIKLHNIENDPLGIIVLMPVNLLILFLVSSISYLSTSLLSIQIKKTIKEINL